MSTRMSYTIYNIYIKVIGIFYYTSQGICFLIADLKFSLKAMFLVSIYAQVIRDVYYSSYERSS